MDVQNLHKDPLVEVRPVWHQVWKSILQTREYTFAERIIKNGKKQPRKTERTKEQDGGIVKNEITYLDILSCDYP